MKLFYTLILFVCISCNGQGTVKKDFHLSQREQIKNKNDTIPSQSIYKSPKKNKYNVQLKIRFRRPYCFGAYLSEEELKIFRKPVLYSHSKFRILNNETQKVYNVKSDGKGIINCSLPKGNYVLKLGLVKNQLLEVPYDEKCKITLDKNWFLFKIDEADTHYEYTFNFTCNNPCKSDAENVPKP